ALRLRAIEERDALAELGVIAIARQDRTARTIDLGDDVHCRLSGLIAEHPLDIADRGQLARAAGAVAHAQSPELDRPFDVDEYGQLAFDAVLDAFEHAVAEAVARDAARGTVDAERCAGRRPMMIALVIAQEDRFARVIGQRIIAPGRKTPTMRIPEPRVRAADIGDHAAEMRIGEHVAPRRGCGSIVAPNDHIFATVRAE